MVCMPVESNVRLGSGVIIFHPEPVNLYGCQIGDGAVHRARDSQLKRSNFWDAPNSTLVAAPFRLSSLLKNPRQNESSLIQFFYHESVEARMRGAFTDQGQLFSYLSPEARVRASHPLR